MPAGSRLECSFCGKAAPKASTLIAGPGVRICAECLQLCDDVLAASEPQS
ncbi:MAG TPA: ClpX C4-type zinc finger protein [Actinophytocola sp.]|nr:ClpX C4-type zinc finger protein [Actinophytocola sp.]HEV2780906.1 ClpX C4-type zinc finger protein [Actinophytocola sp.]